MRKFHPNFQFGAAPTVAVCLVMAAGLIGCATSNPAAIEPVASTTSGLQKIEKPRLFGFLSPYRPDVQQGNFVSEEMMAQLRAGMTRDQVRFLLGTPLLTDIFHADRWDYVFRLQKGNGEILTSRVSIFFNDDRVARYEGGNLPSENKFLNLILGDAESAK
jgi:outer membrane protein assembly factor BamE